jgi:hypothetical protein
MRLLPALEGLAGERTLASGKARRALTRIQGEVGRCCEDVLASLVR